MFNSRFAPVVESDDQTVNPVHLPDDGVVLVRSGHDSGLPSNSVGLTITSPPYFAGKEGAELVGPDGVEIDSYDDYLAMGLTMARHWYDVAEPGARVVVNVARGIGRRPYVPLAADWTDILRQAGFLMRADITWKKAAGAGGSCAWGYPPNSSIRDLTEAVLVASKGRFDRAPTAKKREKAGLPFERLSTVSELAGPLTHDVWEHAPASATRVGHPAPFPPELVEHAMKLWCFKGDVVFDPMGGSGSTGVAARKLGCRFVVCEISPLHAATAAARLGVSAVDNLPTIVSPATL